jgi:predicted nucleic acid-binding protein
MLGRVLRCLIDSMVFDAIAADPALLGDVDRLTRSRRLELLAAAETMLEIGATPDRAHRRRLQAVRVLVVPPVAAADPATARLLASLVAEPGVSQEDARIAAAAAAHGVPLVTEDRDLRLAAAFHLPGLALWDWVGDLAPRLAALARDAAAPGLPASAAWRSGRRW